MEVRGWIASLAFLLAVPATIWLAYEGHNLGFYAYGFIPIAFGIVAAILFGILLVVVLPKLNKDW